MPITWPFDPTVYAGLLVLLFGHAWLARGASDARRQHTVYFLAGLFTVYLVTTALLTVRAHPLRRWIDVAALAVVACIAIFSLGMAAVGFSSPKFAWFPTIPGIVFGMVALLAAIGDVRMLRAGGLVGKQRIARHLWRMCVAMFVATGSFFMGQAKVFPEELRVLPVLALPMFAVLGTMIFWWIRVARGTWPRRARAAQPASPQFGRETPA